MPDNDLSEHDRLRFAAYINARDAIPQGAPVVMTKMRRGWSMWSIAERLNYGGWRPRWLWSVLLRWQDRRHGYDLRYDD